MESIQIRISGRVQGVGFRYHAYRKATELGIRGMVKNLADGSVYMEAEGNKAEIAQLVDWCKSGPTWARVGNVEVKAIPEKGYSGFTIG
jgi:acylphosphatase